MSRFHTITTDFDTNLLNNPAQPEAARERQVTDKASRAWNSPLTQLKPPDVGRPPRIPTERPIALKPTQAWNAPLTQLQPPIVTRVVAHDPVQKFFLGTRFVPIKSLGISIPNLTLDFSPERRYSIGETLSRRFYLVEGRRRYKLIVEGDV